VLILHLPKKPEKRKKKEENSRRRPLFFCHGHRQKGGRKKEKKKKGGKPSGFLLFLSSFFTSFRSKRRKIKRGRRGKGSVDSSYSSTRLWERSKKGGKSSLLPAERERSKGKRKGRLAGLWRRRENEKRKRKESAWPRWSTRSFILTVKSLLEGRGKKNEKGGEPQLPSFVRGGLFPFPRINKEEKIGGGGEALPRSLIPFTSSYDRKKTRGRRRSSLSYPHKNALKRKKNKK